MDSQGLDQHDNNEAEYYCPACGWPLSLYTSGIAGECNNNTCDNDYDWEFHGGKLMIVWTHMLPAKLREDE